MKNLRKSIVTCGLILSLVCNMVGCNNSSDDSGNNGGNSQNTEDNSAPSDSSLSFKSGSYEAIGQGKYGDVVVDVVFTDKEIESVIIGTNQETPDIAKPAFEQIPVAIVDGQTLNVDVVTGATYTSNAILNAVANCVEQAGGDVEALKAKEAPQKDEEQAAEEYTTDIVIVGGGAAGLTAAINASSNGSSVIVLEKGASLAVANGANAGGPIAVGTRVQKAEGEKLTIEKLFTHMNDYANSTINSALLRNVLEQSGPTIDLFQDLGLTVSLRQDAYGVGFRARHKIAEKGEDRTAPQANKIIENGGQIMLNTTGTTILKDENNVVIGVKAKKSNGTEVTVHAKAVLICTGGYLGSQEIIDAKFGKVTINPLGNTLSTGDGLRMIKEVGGVEDRNWGIVANEFSATNKKAGDWTFTSNENLRFGIYGGLLVNRDGNRFFNEEIMATDPLSGAEATLRQGHYYAIMDSSYYDSVCEKGIFKTLGSPKSWIAGLRNLSEEAPESKAHVRVLTNAKDQLQEGIDQGWAYKADTLEDAAEHFGLTNLVSTVDTYNKMCKAKKDTLFYKDKIFLTPVDKGPFYVFEYEPSAWCTIGGVKVDQYLRVLDNTNTPIKGLYAAGIDAGSMYSSPYYDNEGSALGLSFASGTYAGQMMSQYINQD
ncbi:MAG: FAD-dependent oxidoreductase [bacterium]|nr:FAD-dependent oxidoreductase [bacterium]